MDQEHKHDDRGIPTPDEATEGYKPLEAEEQEQKFGIFPPDIAPTIEIGGSAEEQGMLNEEMTT